MGLTLGGAGLSWQQTMLFEKTMHGLANQLVTDTAAAQVKSVLGERHSDEPRVETCGLGPPDEFMGCGGNYEMIRIRHDQ